MPDELRLLEVLLLFNHLVLFYLLYVNASYAFLYLLSMQGLRKFRRSTTHWSALEMMESDYTPPLSILVPSYNEAMTIVENVKALLSLEYGEYEIVVVNDGSRDDTLAVLVQAFQLEKVTPCYPEHLPTRRVRGVYLSPRFPNITVVDKENGGKADSLNAGINVSRYPLFTAIDADSIIERSSLLKVVRPFLEDPKTVAAGGIVRPVNGSRVDHGFIEAIRLSGSVLARFQTVEYLRAFLFGRLGWDRFNGLLIISGAFGVFRKQVVTEAGGYTADTIGEDMELIVRIHKLMRQQKRRYRVVFVPDPVCWTQVPEDLATLRNQRKRWHKGLMDTLLTHRDMLFNPRYGTVGLVAMPYFLFVELLGPVVEILGYAVVLLSFLFGVLSLEFALLFFGVAVGFGVFLSLGAVMLDEYNFRKYDRIVEYLTLGLFSVLENFGYRQLTTWWRLVAMATYRRRQNVWGEMKRTRFQGQEAAAAGRNESP